jgi:ABC-2 type transport system ATP-binding protein
MSAEDTMISINGLTKDFGAFRAVDNISFDVKKGEVLGFLGPNGAGKSTTMKMVAGYLPISNGKASVCGFDVQAHPLESKAKIGYLPEGAPLYGDMTTTGFLNFISEIRGLAGDAKKKQVAYAIDKLELQSVMNQPIDTLSKGFKRRVGFAQAVLHDPEVLILDEPTDGLDPNQKHQVRELISEMATEKAIVISTHILEEVEAVCTRAVIIAAGKIVFDDTPAKLKAQSSSGSLDEVFRQLTLVN